MKLVMMHLFVIGVVGLTHSAPSFTTNDAKRCKPIMKSYGLTARFPGAVAHGIHSITLEDIRHYFKPDATEQNGVPTLNYDLKDKNTVLPNAKLYGYDTSFKTIGMQHLDQVMMNMDREDFYLTNYNTLEKVVHTIHMNEICIHVQY